MTLLNEFYQLPTLEKRNGFGSLSLQTAAIPEVGDSEVLVEVRAVSLNYRDLMMAQGTYRNTTRDELIPCSDGAGVIIKVGAAVKGWKVQDRVMSIFCRDQVKGVNPDAEEVQNALGGNVDGMLTKFKLPAHSLVRVPSHLSFEEAATLPCAAITAWNALFGLSSHSLQPGETIVAEGTGGVSIFTVLFGLATGAHVVLTSSSDDKLERVRAAVPQHAVHLLHTVNYTKTPDWDKEVLRITGGIGASIIVEVGGQATLEKAFGCIRRDGLISAVGYVGGAGSVGNVNSLLIRSSSIFRGVHVGSRELFEAMNRAIEAHAVKPIIDKVFAFGEAQKAYEYQWSGAHVGKVVIQVSQ